MGRRPDRPQGEEEALRGGRAARRAKGLDFDLCFTSFQTRAIKTLNLALEAMGRLWLPVEKDWRLNERHYGGLTGLDKAETAAKHGDEQVKIWRRSFDIPPPLLEPGGAVRPRQATAATPASPIPAHRKPQGHDRARAALLGGARSRRRSRRGERVLISAHGNSLRALVKHLSGISDDEIAGLEIPTGQPIVYELDDDLPRDRALLSLRARLTPSIALTSCLGIDFCQGETSVTQGSPLIGIIMGSRSDWETMRHAAETLDALGVAHETKVVSAHRTPSGSTIMPRARPARGLKVIIAGAGGAAHLPGMAASMTHLPVLGVPVEVQGAVGHR